MKEVLLSERVSERVGLRYLTARSTELRGPKPR